MDQLKRDHVLGKDPSEYATCPTTGCHWTVARSERVIADSLSAQTACPPTIIVQPVQTDVVSMIVGAIG
eukprot:scaffold15108_cov180-Amphora_coffeaeformis.AAC.39